MAPGDGAPSDRGGARSAELAAGSSGTITAPAPVQDRTARGRLRGRLLGASFLMLFVELA